MRWRNERKNKEHPATWKGGAALNVSSFALAHSLKGVSSNVTLEGNALGRGNGKTKNQ
jgi:hypothetical protein